MTPAGIMRHMPRGASSAAPGGACVARGVFGFCATQSEPFNCSHTDDCREKDVQRRDSTSGSFQRLLTFLTFLKEAILLPSPAPAPAPAAAAAPVLARWPPDASPGYVPRWLALLFALNCTARRTLSIMGHPCNALGLELMLDSVYLLTSEVDRHAAGVSQTRSKCLMMHSAQMQPHSAG